jgi:NAD(P)H-dependent flavin oxidoreductase YrpB (nitropropane dioxygenase family)
MNKLPSLKIGRLDINPPFILGGMGVRITNHVLAAAVANLGMAGTIASVGLCDRKTKREQYASASNAALIKEIRAARELTKGVIGVNIMVALTNYEELAKTAAKENVDYIISGAGLPLDLPELTKGSNTALIPIVSSVRAADIILKKWRKKYDRLPDAFIVEGALAGGHLGYNLKEIDGWNKDSLADICKEIILLCKEIEKETGQHIPVIAAGGLYDGADIAKMLKIGVEGVQLATRFIATIECSIPDKIKQALIKSRKDDIVVINSPVGLPGRVLKNKFVERILRGEKMKFDCPYHCLKTCTPETAPFCIAEALVNAYEGDFDNGIIMPGSNAYKIKKIVPVKELVDTLVNETIQNMNLKGK